MTAPSANPHGAQLPPPGGCIPGPPGVRARALTPRVSRPSSLHSTVRRQPLSFRLYVSFTGFLPPKVVILPSSVHRSSLQLWGCLRPSRKADTRRGPSGRGTTGKDRRSADADPLPRRPLRQGPAQKPIRLESPPPGMAPPGCLLGHGCIQVGFLASGSCPFAFASDSSGDSGDSIPSVTSNHSAKLNGNHPTNGRDPTPFHGYLHQILPKRGR